MNIKHWPVIRHVRYFYHAWRLARWVREWASYGIGLGVPQKSDLDYLDLIWRGQR